MPPLNEEEEFEFRARAEQETQQKMDGKPPLGFVAKQMWRMMPQNPKNLLNNLPLATGAVGGVSPIIGGATMGTAAGQGIRDLILKGLKKPIPSGMQHIGEIGRAVAGDVLAIPMIKKAHYGSQIGEAEKAAGVVTRAPTKAVTPGSVGETLNNLEAQLDSGMINTPQTARDAKAVVNQIYKNPRIYEQTGDIKVQSFRVSRKVQDVLNRMIPGRMEPSQLMGKAMTIPNAIGRGYKAIPWQAKLGMLGGGADAIIRKLFGI